MTRLSFVRSLKVDVTDTSCSERADAETSPTKLDGTVEKGQVSSKNNDDLLSSVIASRDQNIGNPPDRVDCVLEIVQHEETEGHPTLEEMSLTPKGSFRSEKVAPYPFLASISKLKILFRSNAVDNNNMMHKSNAATAELL